MEVDEFLETSLPGVYAMEDVKGGPAFTDLSYDDCRLLQAIETGETRGFMKAIVDADSGQILGCAVLGSEGGEIMTNIQVAMLGNLTYAELSTAIFTHPILAEGLNSLFELFDN